MFKEYEELEALLVGDVGEGVVGGGAVEHGEEAGVGVVHAVVRDVLPQGSIAQDGLHISEASRVELFTDLSLFKDGETFIEPHIFPVLTGYVISGP